MFSSAKGRIPVLDDTDTPSTSNSYSSFLLLERNRQEQLQALSENDQSGSDVEVTGEVIRTKKKKEKKRKSKHKKHKRSRRHSSSSDSITSFGSRPQSPEEEKVDNYNFTRNVKRFGLKVHPRALISITQLNSVIDDLYPGQFYDRENRYFNAKTARKLEKPAKERIFRKIRHDQSETFIPLSTEPAGEDVERESNLESFYTGMNAEEFDIFMKGQSVGIDGLTYDERRKLLKSKLKYNPRNKELWDEFLEFEDKELEEAARSAGVSVDSLAPVYFERKVEIIKDAIRNLPGHFKFEFLMEQLYAMSRINELESEKVKEFYNKLKSSYPNQPEVSRFAIRVNLTDRFQLNRVISLYDETIVRMIAINNGTFVSHCALPSTPGYVVELIRNRCRLLIEAGYLHRALAMTQAVIEYYCFPPKDVKNATNSVKIKRFLTFWESGAPRIGDDGAKGWMNTRISEIDLKVFREEEKQNILMEYEEQSAAERSLISPVYGSTWNECIFWNQLEQIRINISWRPLRQPKMGEDYGYETRYVGLSDFGANLLDLGENVNVEELVFSLLRTIGIVDPMKEDDGHQNVFRVLCPEYSSSSLIPIKGFPQFQFIDSGRCLQALVKTVTINLRLSGSTPSESLKEINSLHKSLPKGPQIASHLAFFSILDSLATFAGLRSTFTGVNTDDYCVGEKKTARQRVVTSYLTYLNQNPFNLPANVQRQIVLEAAFRLCQKLPSKHSRKGKFVINRLRLLTFLVVDKIKNFLDVNALISDEDIKTARDFWQDQFQTFSTLEEPVGDDAKSINSTQDIVFELFSVFMFECTGVSAFTNDNVNGFVEKSRNRIQIRLDFAFELAEHHLFDFKEYSKWVDEAFDRYPDQVNVYRHLTNVYSVKSCHELSLIKLNEKNDLKRNARLLCRIAAVYRRLQKAKENDDEVVVDGLDTWFRKFFDESISFLSKRGVPDSFMWKFFLNYQHENNKTFKFESMYPVAMRDCPYSKSLMMEESKSPFVLERMIDDIKYFADNYGLYIMTLPEEARILRQQASRLVI
ncbi:unnamed protein product [Bursaphelenchus xylophilus]|uniref:(pine wood nematode) hypothetical protein n=1 Tax=Bursaphelenchus xylophilus TaxID=6326 RepID=A0A7I8WR74_BURXY|nr:unnamed protein product [Bursaphelenchus xylophilus]CAG9097649.1 unnamed protein product [Bursaphelenchus xylophilus]